MRIALVRRMAVLRFIRTVMANIIRTTDVLHYLMVYLIMVGLYILI